MIPPLMLSAVLLLAALAGCSTIDSRIEERAGAFAMLQPEAQERVRAGRITIGDTKDVVYIALGEPDAMFSRSETGGVVYDIWSYAGVYYTRDTVWRHSMPFRRRRHQGSDYYAGPEYVDVQHEYERLRIEFDGDKVKAIEQAARQ